MAREPAQHRPASIGKAHKQPKRHQAADIRRGSARDRGYSTAWDKFSRDFRRRNPLCEYCLADGITKPATVTDHDTPHGGDPELFWGGPFSALCAPCHNGAKARAEARYSGDDLLQWVARRKQPKRLPQAHTGGG